MKKTFAAGFTIYLFFVVSWFVHLTNRVPLLGSIRFDLILVLILFGLSFLKAEGRSSRDFSPIEKYLILLITYAVVTIPFVEWPGSVLRYGIPNFVKAIVFYFFTVKFIKTERQLKIFIGVFMAVQTFRILEPLYLHITQGYWGSRASMANWEFMNRLSGAPHDIVNPNGLAFIIVTVTPFLFCYAATNGRVLLLSLFLVPLFVWVLILTASRSGFVAMVAIVIFFTLKARHKIIIVMVAMIGACIAYQHMTPDQKDRYLSIFSSHTKNAATAEGRIEGVIRNFRVAMRRPIFGHGLGTSLEANANFGRRAQPAHNLYAELLQELGFMGLFIFLGYIYSVSKVIRKSQELRSIQGINESSFIKSTWKALWIFFFTNLLFSLASYGLSGYEWYLIPGLVVVLLNLQRCNENNRVETYNAKESYV